MDAVGVNELVISPVLLLTHPFAHGSYPYVRAQFPVLAAHASGVEGFSLAHEIRFKPS